MKKKIILRLFFSFLIIGGLIFGIKTFIYSKNHEETDNAQLETNINPIIPKVSGYITGLKIEDNQLVKKGDTLFTIDDRDLSNRVILAEAAYRNAMANVEVMRSNLSSANATTEINNANQLVSDASIKTAEAKLWKAQQDFQRYKNLLEDDAATQQQFDAAKTDKEVAEAELSVLRRQLLSSGKQLNASKTEAHTSLKQIAVAQAIVEQRKADLEFARLQLSYSVVTAPADGYVSKKSIQLGQYVNAGQTVFSLIENTDIWVIANFKETQLKKMKVGSEVEIKVDAFDDKPLKGVVLSFARATGARFSLLPPDNATGNFVKVVQRIPVKILITEAGETLKRLSPGMSAKVAVAI
jgi:membrane fusion protein (multidrug efflux system)